MFGLVVVTHGKLARDFIATTEHVVGPQSRIRAICIDPEDDMEVRRRDILNAVSETDTGDGVVILTDMFGGTPSNLAISVMDLARVEVIAGLNMPMLIKLATIRDMPIEDAAMEAQRAGQKYIRVASRISPGRKVG